MTNSFGAKRTMTAGGRSFRIAHLPTLEAAGLPVARLPYALKILLENLLRREDGRVVPVEDVEAVARWQPEAEPNVEIAFMPGRVLLQDFTGVPAVVDLAAMRDAMARMGSDAAKINPLQPAELVIDHSVQVDEYGSAAALLINAEREFERNEERYLFLRWGQTAFENFRVVPPATGIVHQVNLEYLARGVMTSQNGAGDVPFAYPDTLVGTDSHTTMINGLGVLGWGVGGIEAEAAMLGQPIAMLVPQVVGFRLVDRLPEGTTATDLVLRVTEMLRNHGVVGKFVEFFGPGLSELRLADRATIANMAPEYGATCGIFPIDRAAIDYLRFTGRDEAQVELVEAYCREQGLFHGPDTPEAEYSDTLELDLSTVEPSLAGPRRPQDRIRLSEVKESFLSQLPQLSNRSGGPAEQPADEGGQRQRVAAARGLPVIAGDGPDSDAEPAPAAADHGAKAEVTDGSVVIAAITSCTNTSNPSVMLAAGLLAKNAVRAGLRPRPWVKTSLAPGSKVVTDYLAEAGLTAHLEQLGFHTVGYGCTTCIGNSGPLPPAVSAAIAEDDLVAVSVLSGNRNFEGRISSEVRANYLASPPLVVAYALAGRIDIDLYNEPLAAGPNGPVYLRDIWPAQADIQAALESSLRPEMFERQYADVFAGGEAWQALDVPSGQTFDWRPDSTYVKEPPFFIDMPRSPQPVEDIHGARVLAMLGDTVTTDHISPAGPISPDSPAADYLRGLGVGQARFNSYGARRGNHEVMMRGTFANVRLRNQLVPGTEGGYTVLLPEGARTTIFDAAAAYRERGVPQIILAGLEYGTGSSRDWAAKGPRLLGVRAVIARSYERIHRSNLVGMGIAPLQFQDGEGPEELGLTGREAYDVEGLAAGLAADFEPGLEVTVRATGEHGEIRFRALVRLDTPQEAEYYRHAGILQYVLRQLLDDGA